METPYKAVSFDKHDIVTRDVLDQLNNNTRWVQENTPRSRFYRDLLEPSAENGVLIGGMVKIAKNKKSDTATVNVSFPTAFAPDCTPAVTTAVVADFQTKIFCSVTGLDQSGYPSANGFKVIVDVDSGKGVGIKKNFWVHWNAFGYRADDINEF